MAHLSQQDAKKIGKNCLNAFHHVMNGIHQGTSKQPSQNLIALSGLGTCSLAAVGEWVNTPPILNGITQTAALSLCVAYATTVISSKIGHGLATLTQRFHKETPTLMTKRSKQFGAIILATSAITSGGLIIPGTLTSSFQSAERDLQHRALFDRPAIPKTNALKPK